MMHFAQSLPQISFFQGAVFIVLFIFGMRFLTQTLGNWYFKHGRNHLIKAMRLPSEEVQRINGYEDKRGIRHS